MIEQMSLEEFRSKYADIRNQVYKEVPLIVGMPALKLTPVNSAALAALSRWPDRGRTPPNGGWDWGSWTEYFKTRHKKYFDVAIWNGAKLCGLALGRLSLHNVKVRLEIIEGSTEKNHPLKGQIAYIGLTAIEAFGYVVGAEESLIIDPVPGAIASYRSYGYTLKSGNKQTGQYMSKLLK